MQKRTKSKNMKWVSEKENKNIYHKPKGGENNCRKNLKQTLKRRKKNKVKRKHQDLKLEKDWTRHSERYLI